MNIQCSSVTREFMKRFNCGYTKYFNHKYKRSGVLFQGKFKSSHIDSNEYLLHASVYVNLNNRVHKIEKGKAHSSSEEFSGPKTEGFCSKNIILKQFKNKKEYKECGERKAARRFCLAASH